MISRKLLYLASVIAFAAALALGFGATASAEDLSDNATCLECHADVVVHRLSRNDYRDSAPRGNRRLGGEL